MRKVFCIGLDGATFDLIKPFIAQGKLPLTFRNVALYNTTAQV